MRGLLPILMALPLLASCGTIDQAPLVYVSTVQVGIGAETGTTAVPGAKVLIGVQTTDAAVVPVATGRNCGKNSTNLCTSADFPIEQVRGNNQFSVSEIFEQARAKADALKLADTEVERSSAALRTLVELEKELAEKAHQYDQSRAKILAYEQGLSVASSAIASAAPQSGTPTTQDLASQKPVSIVDAESFTKANANVIEELRSATTNRLAAESSLQIAVREAERRRTELAALLAQEPGSAGARLDALSVYGTFNTDTKVTAGSSTTAGLNLGKTFSTGVAAQILAEGIKEAAKSGSSCLATAAQIATRYDPPADSKEVLLAALHACGQYTKPKPPAVAQ